MVIPVSDPGLAREVIADRLAETKFTISWIGRKRPEAYAVALRLEVPRLPLSSRTTTQLRASAFDKTGRPIDVGVLHWTSLDPAVATIDSPSGVLTPRREGKARIRATLGGWISSDTTVEIADRPALVLFTEDWKHGFEKNFIPFGIPVPTVESAPGLGLAMHSNGDGSFVSGVYSKASFDGSAGLGMEASVSTPINLMQWQTLALEITSELDSASLARWDHRTWAPPNLSRPATAGRCTIVIPGSEGYENFHKIAVGDVELTRTPLDSSHYSGRPFRIAVQLLPDGRCVGAVDGRVIARAAGLPIKNARYHLAIYGNSYETQIAVGPLNVWSGIQARFGSLP
jgi:hypothetical protein